jgi:hypothetical protein
MASRCAAPSRSLGEVPRAECPHPELERIEQAFADKYAGGVIVRDGLHSWLRLRPATAVSWDQRKSIAEAGES